MLKLCSELSWDDIESTVQQGIDAKQLGGALDVIRSTVDSIINNPRSVARIYASRRLDGLCEQVAAAARSSLPEAPGRSSPPGGTVIMATELAAAGGHVEVIKDLVRLADLPQPVTLLLTDGFGRVDASTQSTYAKSIGVPHVIATGTDSQQRLHAILRHLKARQPHALVLLVHNQDSTGVVAALASNVAKVRFVHHGDHHLSLGVTCASFEHVDISNFAFFNCRHALGLQQNTFWPLTLNAEQIPSHQKTFMKHGKLITCCAGRAEKFDDPTYLYQYLDLVGAMLAATQGEHIHIGPLSDPQLDRMRLSLRAHGIDASRLKHIPWVPSVSQALIDHDVDLYMTSFPYGGGKSQVEAMAAGLPVLVHQNYRSRFLSGIDIGYPGTLSWETSHELSKILGSIDRNLLETHSGLASRHFQKHHSEAAFREAVANDRADEIDVPELAKVYSDGLQRFLDEEKSMQLSPTQQQLTSAMTALHELRLENHVLRKKARFLGGLRYKIRQTLGR